MAEFILADEDLGDELVVTKTIVWTIINYAYESTSLSSLYSPKYDR